MPEEKPAFPQKVWSESFFDVAIAKNFVWLWLPFYSVLFGIRNILAFVTTGKGIEAKDEKPKI